MLRDMQRLWVLSPCARRARRADEGFSVIEVVIAMAVFAIVGAFMSQLLGAGFKGVLLGKRRELATQEANRMLEIARSLSYDAIGLIESDPTIPTDTANIVEQSGVPSFRPDTEWEPIVFAPDPDNHPFNPHIRAVTRAATDLTDYIYVTGVDSNGDDAVDLKRITVRVVWDASGATGAANEVRAQTLVNAEGGIVCQQPCDDTTTDNITPLKGDSLASGGALTVKSSLLGLSAPLNITLPNSRGSSRFRLVSDASCTTHSASIRATDLVDLPGYTASATADNDAASNTPSDPAADTDTGILAIPGGSLSTLLGATLSSPVSCDATTDPLPQENGEASALSALNAQTNVVALGGLLNWLLTIANVDADPVTQEIAHENVGGQREIAVSAQNALGTSQLLKIPGLIGDGLVQLNAFTYGASVRGAANTPSAPPAITAPSFSIRIFDNGNKLGAGCATAIGTGITATRSGSYCVVTITPNTAGFAGKTITLTHNFTQLLGLNIVNLAYTTTIDLLPSAKSAAAGVEGPNGERRWNAEFTPLAVSASLDASVLGVSLIDVDVDLNLGAVEAKACAGATCL
jgi:prepilin-type N-terminal cleavage/methylation domain-containing protein